MNIVLFPSAYAPAFGGVEELTARLAASLTAAGHSVEVWVIRYPDTLPSVERIDAITVRRFDLVMPAMNARALARFPRRGGAALRALHSAAARFEPDVIHVQCFSVNGVYATALARLCGARLVVSLQGETVMDDTDIYTHSVALRAGLRWGLKRADAVTGCSRFVLEDAERRFGLPPGSATVVPNGVDAAESAAPEAIDLPFERFILAYGRVVPKKGFDLLLEAFELIADRHPDLGLLIGGDGAERPLLQARVKAAGLEARVALPGRLDRGQVAWATSRAAIFVLPSRVEPFGIVVLEAMRAGLPVVVSEHGGAPDMVRDGIEGFVVDPNDRALLADRISRLAGDPDLARRCGAAGLERVQSYSWSAITRQYEQLY